MTYLPTWTVLRTLNLKSLLIMSLKEVLSGFIKELQMSRITRGLKPNMSVLLSMPSVW